MSMYIHIADPGFPDPEHPDDPSRGMRRLGPFNTLAEAVAQAASDAAVGMGLALGVFGEDGEQLVSAEDIQVEADALVKERDAEVAHRTEALADFLAEKGITVEELREVGLLP